MARHSDSGRKTSLHNLSSTVTTTNGNQRYVDRCKVPELRKPDTSEGAIAGAKMTCKTCARTRTLGKGVSKW